MIELTDEFREGVKKLLEVARQKVTYLGETSLFT